jgi:hypothetical protein
MPKTTNLSSITPTTFKQITIASKTKTSTWTISNRQIRTSTSLTHHGPVILVDLKTWHLGIPAQIVKHLSRHIGNVIIATTKIYHGGKSATDALNQGKGKN